MTRRRTWMLVSLVALGLVGIAVDPSGLQRTLRLKGDLSELRAANQALKVETERLRRELKALADDPVALERAAREELGLIRPGELVFRLEDGDEASVP